VQELCLAVLVFREGRRRTEERVQQALCAAVAAGRIDPAVAWPDIFGKPKSGDDEAFPEVGADMSEFSWEHPSADQAAEELEQLMHGASVTLTGPGGDGPLFAAPPSPPPEPEAALRPGAPVPADASALEWG
jgi:hypothetical protein